MTAASPPTQSERPASLAAALDVTDFTPLGRPPTSRDPVEWPGYQRKLAEARQRCGVEQAVTAGHALVGGEACVLVVFHFDFLGGSMGHAEGELLSRALEEARTSRQPLVSVGRSGGARMQEGTVSLFQMPRIARGLTALAHAGVPHIAITDDPTTGGVWASLIAAADIVIGRAGAQVAFAGTRVLTGELDQQSQYTAENKQASGFIDIVPTDAEMTPTLASYLRMLSPLTRGAPTEPPLPVLIRDQPVAALDGWDSVRAARSGTRPAAEQYLADYFTETLPVWGDRVGGVDKHIACGLGRRDGHTIAFVCQRGGKVGAAGFRTANRLIALACRLSVPVITFVDTAGADNSPAAERSGVGTAIATLLQQVACCTVPMLSVVVGQGVSGGAISLINPDNMWMAPDSYLAVIAPEAAAEILKQNPSTVAKLSDQLALSPHRLQELGLSRGVLAPAAPHR